MKVMETLRIQPLLVISFQDFLKNYRRTLKKNRLYISDHNLGEEDSENLREIVSFMIYQYAKMWFEIKCKNKLIHGPDNALLNI